VSQLFERQPLSEPQRVFEPPLSEPPPLSEAPASLRPSVPPPSERIIVYTDGACKGNPGPGGWAWVLPGERFDSGAQWSTTNNRMELTAAVEAVGNLDGQLLVITDSRYMSDCFNKRWWVQWERNNWRTKNKTAVKNQDLWRPLIDAYKSGKVEFDWIKAHAGHPGNEEADWLANQAIRQLKCDS